MNKKNGFTLIETAIVVLVIGLLLGGLLMPLTAQLDQRRISETQKALQDAREALIGYAASRPTPYLPCPDKTVAAGPGTANDGLEDVGPGGACVTQHGNIPWATLGVSDIDAWGNRIHYSVTPAYSNRSPGTFTLASAGTLNVCRNAPVPPATTCAVTVAAAVPAVILSYGKNGYGAINSSGNQNPLPCNTCAGPPPVPPPCTNACADEFENTNSNTNFVSRTPSLPGSPAGEFDDEVSWLSAGLLHSRMISAQKLP